MTKNESKNKVTVFKNEVEGSKEIKTKYEILDFNGKFSLAEIELLTGKQPSDIETDMATNSDIRLWAIQNTAKAKNKQQHKYQALYSYNLKFNLPKFEKIGAHSFCYGAVREPCTSGVCRRNWNTDRRPAAIVPSIRNGRFSIFVLAHDEVTAAGRSWRGQSVLNCKACTLPELGFEKAVNNTKISDKQW